MKLIRLVVVVLLLLNPAVSRAESIERNILKKSPTVTKIRQGIISEGIAACEAENYFKAVQLLEKFLNQRKVIATSLETRGFGCLAIAYQYLGQPTRAVETVIQAISITDDSTIELADLEHTAGIIADRQRKKTVAIAHWEKARRLYLAHNISDRWADTTLKLAESYQELGNLAKSQQLLQELERLGYSDRAKPHLDKVSHPVGWATRS